MKFNLLAFQVGLYNETITKLSCRISTIYRSPPMCYNGFDDYTLLRHLAAVVHASGMQKTIYVCN
jgi:hypothetical protein